MATGPRGERRPADVIGAAIMVAKLATGELSETPHQNPAECAADMLEPKLARRS
jgi:hypothetical protein